MMSGAKRVVVTLAAVFLLLLVAKDEGRPKTTLGTKTSIVALRGGIYAREGPSVEIPHLAFFPDPSLFGTKQQQQHPREEVESQKKRVVSLPLVVYLHGMGEAGDDLVKLVATGRGTIPTILATPTGVVWGAKHPLLDGRFKTIVLMPQASTSWQNEEHIDNVAALIEKYSKTTFCLSSAGKAGSEYEADTFGHLPEEGRVAAFWNRMRTAKFGPSYFESWKEITDLSSCTGYLVQIDRTKVLATGASNGGHGVYQLAIRHPNLLAAIAPVCGFFDAPPLSQDGGQWGRTSALCASLVSSTKQCFMVVNAYHGANDAVVPVELSDHVLAQCKHAGACVTFNRLPTTPDAEGGQDGNGHAAWIPAYSPESQLWNIFQLR